jgi:hypothetical protein
MIEEGSQVSFESKLGPFVNKSEKNEIKFQRITQKKK